MNTGNVRRSDDVAVITTVASPPGVVTFAIRGRVTFETVAQLGVSCRAVLDAEPEVATVVLDVLRIDGFEPGVPARIIQWLGAQSERIHTGALVTVSPVLMATVRAAALLLPRTQVFPCASTGEAFARVGEQRRRSDTGTTLRGSLTAAMTAAQRKQAG